MFDSPQVLRAQPSPIQHVIIALRLVQLALALAWSISSLLQFLARVALWLMIKALRSP
jgi:hypothetical protein